MAHQEVNVVNYDYFILDVDERYKHTKIKSKKYPVVRIFGSNLEGYQTCVFVHGYFPYFYFRPENYDDLMFQNETVIRRLLPVFRSKINKGLSTKRLKENIQPDGNYVHSLDIVSKYTIYGYYPDLLYFVKVQLYHPDDVMRLVHLIDEGLFGVPMQTYESHLPYLLKFTNDNHIKPMSYCKLGDKFNMRLPILLPLQLNTCTLSENENDRELLWTSKTNQTNIKNAHVDDKSTSIKDNMKECVSSNARHHSHQNTLTYETLSENDDKVDRINYTSHSQSEASSNSCQYTIYLSQLWHPIKPLSPRQILLDNKLIDHILEESNTESKDNERLANVTGLKNSMTHPKENFMSIDKATTTATTTSDPLPYIPLSEQLSKNLEDADPAVREHIFSLFDGIHTQDMIWTQFPAPVPTHPTSTATIPTSLPINKSPSSTIEAPTTSTVVSIIMKEEEEEEEVEVDGVSMKLHVASKEKKSVIPELKHDDAKPANISSDYPALQGDEEFSERKKEQLEEQDGVTHYYARYYIQPSDHIASKSTGFTTTIATATTTTATSSSSSSSSSSSAKDNSDSNNNIRYNVFCINKMTTCRIEIDIYIDDFYYANKSIRTPSTQHVPSSQQSHISAASSSSTTSNNTTNTTPINTQILSGFGMELWEEEYNRREKEGLPREEIVTELPSTITRHWPIYPHDMNMLFRMNRLLYKGLLLYQINHQLYDSIMLDGNGTLDRENMSQSIFIHDTLTPIQDYSNYHGNTDNPNLLHDSILDITTLGKSMNVTDSPFILDNVNSPNLSNTDMTPYKQTKEYNFHSGYKDSTEISPTIQDVNQSTPLSPSPMKPLYSSNDINQALQLTQRKYSTYWTKSQVNLTPPPNMINLHSNTDTIYNMTTSASFSHNVDKNNASFIHPSTSAIATTTTSMSLTDPMDPTIQLWLTQQQKIEERNILAYNEQSQYLFNHTLSQEFNTVANHTTHLNGKSSTTTTTTTHSSSDKVIDINRQLFRNSDTLIGSNKNQSSNILNPSSNRIGYNREMKVDDISDEDELEEEEDVEMSYIEEIQNILSSTQPDPPVKTTSSSTTTTTTSIRTTVDSTDKLSSQPIYDSGDMKTLNSQSIDNQRQILNNEVIPPTCQVIGVDDVPSLLPYVGSTDDHSYQNILKDNVSNIKPVLSSLDLFTPQNQLFHQSEECTDKPMKKKVKIDTSLCHLEEQQCSHTHEDRIDRKLDVETHLDRTNIRSFEKRKTTSHDKDRNNRKLSISSVFKRNKSTNSKAMKSNIKENRNSSHENSVPTDHQGNSTPAHITDSLDHINRSGIRIHPPSLDVMTNSSMNRETIAESYMTTSSHNTSKKRKSYAVRFKLNHSQQSSKYHQDQSISDDIDYFSGLVDDSYDTIALTETSNLNPKVSIHENIDNDSHDGHDNNEVRVHNATSSPYNALKVKNIRDKLLLKESSIINSSDSQDISPRISITSSLDSGQSPLYINESTYTLTQSTPIEASTSLSYLQSSPTNQDPNLQSTGISITPASTKVISQSDDYKDYIGNDRQSLSPYDIQSNISVMTGILHHTPIPYNLHSYAILPSFPSPPPASQLLSTLDTYGIPYVVNIPPFYGQDNDCLDPLKSTTVTVAGHKVTVKTASNLSPFPHQTIKSHNDKDSIGNNSNECTLSKLIDLTHKYPDAGISYQWSRTDSKSGGNNNSEIYVIKPSVDTVTIDDSIILIDTIPGHHNGHISTDNGDMNKESLTNSHHKKDVIIYNVDEDSYDIQTTSNVTLMKTLSSSSSVAAAALTKDMKYQDVNRSQVHIVGDTTAIVPSTQGLLPTHTRRYQYCFHPSFLPPSPFSIQKDLEQGLLHSSSSSSSNNGKYSQESIEKSQISTPTQTNTKVYDMAVNAQKMKTTKVISHPKKVEKTTNSTTTTTAITSKDHKFNVNNSEDTNTNTSSDPEDNNITAPATAPSSTNINKKTYTRVCSMELFCCSRIHDKIVLTPDPRYDSIQIITYVIEEIIADSESENKQVYYGIIQLFPPSSENSNSSSSSSSSSNSHMPSTSCSSKDTGGGSKNDPSLETKKNNTTTTNMQYQRYDRKQRNQVRYLKSTSLLPTSTDYYLESTEMDVITRFHMIMHHYDVDFFIGYEIQNKSFGYLIERCKMLQINSLQLLSRIPNEIPSRRNEYDVYSEEHDSGIFITGRIVINIWRIISHECKLANYTFNYVTSEVLGRTLPSYSQYQLTAWYKQITKQKQVFYHLMQCTMINLELLHKLDFFRRTSESARLYGIDFYSVISRGSQYRVEASMIQIAHSKNYLVISPSKQKVANQAPMAVIPLVMEPESRLYHDPIIVLDFQSLYPSMIIAYNLCYSTILGKLHIGQNGEMDTTGHLGVIHYPEYITAHHIFTQHAYHTHPHITSAGNNTSNNNHNNISINNSMKDASIKMVHDYLRHHTIPTTTMESLYDIDNQTFLAPNGSIFCSKSTRLGILPMMLKDILETRFMIKRAMKRYDDYTKHESQYNNIDQYDILKRVLDARQLSIKNLANVTYGYTSAGYSGRMPMAELADSIVQCGRSTLEWAAGYIRQHPNWHASVVYGDTDSLFVHVPGRTKDQAIILGNEIALEITSKCPPGVVLKYEKVYHPCILASKKRYVGRAFETVSQKEGHFDAKGIESVRRDQCPMTIKIQEKALRILFDTLDLSQVKSYLIKQWNKIHQGHEYVPLIDYIFSKEVKFGHYRGQPPPGAEVAAQNMIKDPMCKPPYRWRVPYIIVCGSQTARLIDLAVNPIDILKRGNGLKINVVYYITKCINPALERVLGLTGVDIKEWYTSMKKKKSFIRHIQYEEYSEDMLMMSTPYETTRTPSVRTYQENGMKLSSSSSSKLRQQSMDRFTIRGHCINCGQESVTSLCTLCQQDPVLTLTSIQHKLNYYYQQNITYENICTNCAKTNQSMILFVKDQLIGPHTCESIYCNIFYKRWKTILHIEDYEQGFHELPAEYVHHPIPSSDHTCIYEIGTNATQSLSNSRHTIRQVINNQSMLTTTSTRHEDIIILSGW